MRVHACGICGSDIHQLRDGWGFKPGAVAGHEWSGTIAAVGDDVTGWSVGELVVGGASPRCGTCRRCREGKPSQCENRQSMTGEHTRRRLRRVRRRAGVRRAAAARGPLAATRRPGRAAVGRPARHHPLGRPARRHRHGLRRRADRRAERRGAAVDGHHRHHGRRAPRGPAPPGRPRSVSPPSWTPPTSRRSRRGSPNACPRAPSTSSWSAPGTGRRSRRASANWRAAASW